MKYPLIFLMSILLLSLAACGQPATETPAAPAADVVDEAVAEPESQPDAEAAQTADDSENSEDAVPQAEESAAAAADPPAPAADAPAAEAVETESSEETTTAADTVAPAEEIDWLMVSHRTDFDLAVLGNPDAPLTMIEYSDFL